MSIEARLILFLIGIGAVWGWFKLLSGGFALGDIALLVTVNTPLFLAAVVAMSATWVGIGLGSLAFPYPIPLSILARLEVSTLIILILAGVTIVQSTLKKGGQRVLFSTASRLMFLASLLIWVRFIYDRPGSARLSDFGGLGEAFMFVTGTVGYFLMARLMNTNWNVGRNLRAVTVIFIFALILNTALSAPSGLLYNVRGLFHRQMWFLCPLMLAAAFQRLRRPGAFFPEALVLGLSAFTLLLGIVSPHRSRPIFAIGIVLGVAWMYGHFSKALKLMALPIAAAALFMLIAGSDIVPMSIPRSLSVLVPTSKSQVHEYVQPYDIGLERGWSSPIRARLNELAWWEIRSHPLTGKGFVISRDEVLWAVARSGAVEEAVQGLAISGCYHNAVIELAVFCGLPVALLFAGAYVLGLKRFLEAVPRINDPQLKIMAAGILGLFIATSGQMLMNGSGRDFFYICVLLGTMQGIQVRIRTLHAESVATQPLSLADGRK